MRNREIIFGLPQLPNINLPEVVITAPKVEKNEIPKGLTSGENSAAIIVVIIAVFALVGFFAYKVTK